MGQAVKYIILAACITLALASALALINELYPIEIVNNFGNALTNLLSVASTVITNVRGAFNYVLGSHLPLTISVAFWIFVPFLRVALKVVVMVLRWFNQ